MINVEYLYCYLSIGKIDSTFTVPHHGFGHLYNNSMSGGHVGPTIVGPSGICVLLSLKYFPVPYVLSKKIHTLLMCAYVLPWFSLKLNPGAEWRLAAEV